jgi:hypothetical protein
VPFLGHIISNGGISVDHAKVKTIVVWSIPTTVTKIQSFLGLVGYYRKFIEEFSKVAKRMTSLLEKEREFKWDDKYQDRFNQLKLRLMSPQCWLCQICKRDLTFIVMHVAKAWDVCSCKKDM